MELDIASRLKGFPDAPAMVREALLLANDPHAHLAQVANIISKDPALAAKILRAANSTFYSRRRESNNLRQAVATLGINAAAELVVAFSIAPFYRGLEASGLNYSRCWHRALLSAMIAREIGEHLVLAYAEQTFLAALLQDIGMLVLEQSDRQFYAELSPNANHDEVCRYELARLGADHAQVGAMLLASWHLPQPLCAAVEQSHGVEIDATQSALEPLSLCVAVAARLADAMLAADCIAQTALVWRRLHGLLGLDSAGLWELATATISTLSEMEQVYETPVLNRHATHALLEQARISLSPRSITSVEQAPRLQAHNDQPKVGAQEIEDQSRQDALTGVYNRRHLDAALEMEFVVAGRTNSPLSVIFIELDHFKLINVRHGHAVGDEVLRNTAKLIRTSLRDTDLVARYGGKEFVVVLPGTDSAGAAIVADRILKTLRGAVLSLEGGSNLSFTASLGLATLARVTPFPSASDLVLAAERAAARQLDQ